MIKSRGWTVSSGLITTSTYFKRNNIYKAIGGVRMENESNQSFVDRKKEQKCIRKVRAYRGPDHLC